MKVNRFFPFLLIFSLVSCAMEIELSLPSFPDIARAFGVAESVIEGTISLNFIGFCISALLYGPLADRFGRRPLMCCGMAIYFLGSLGCTLSPTITLILISRLIQGLGASAACVIVFTMISDVYKGEKAIGWIGKLNAILTTTMAGAPILGGFLNAQFGWKACYTSITFLSAITLLLIFFLLPETKKGVPVKFKDIRADYRTLLSSRRFLQSAVVPTLLAGGYMAFVSVIPFLYRNELKMPLMDFSLHQTLIIAAFSLLSYLAYKVIALMGEKKSVLISLAISSSATMSLFVMSSFVKIPPAWQITPLMVVFAATCAIAFTAVFSASLAIFPEKNGTASSIIMSMRTLVCAGTVQLAGWFYNATVFPTMAIVTLCSLFSLLLAYGFYRSKATSPVLAEVKADTVLAKVNED